MLRGRKSIELARPELLLPGVSNFVTFRQCVYEKLEKQQIRLFWDRPRKLLVRHSVPKSEMFCLLRHVIAVNVEHHLLPQLSVSRDLSGRERRLGTRTREG